MRKIFSTVMAAMAAAVLTAASAFAGTVTKDYDLKGFKAIDASNSFSVTVNKSDRYDVKVTVAEEYEDYLDIHVSAGRLCIAFRNLPAMLKAGNVAQNASVSVSMPTLEGVTLSGASKLSSDDRFDLGRGVFNVSVSGASHLENLDISASEARIYVSGAARCTLSGDFVDMRLNISGSSRAEIDASADDVDAKTSGASVLEALGRFDEIRLTASGASNITMRGEAEEIRMNGSGSSSLSLADMKTESAEVSLSGAAVAKVNAYEEISVTLTGASRCSYIGHKGLEIHKRSVSRGSSLKEL